MQQYHDFLAAKTLRFDPTGFEVSDSELNPILKPFQAAIVKWALRRGRAAIFADTGLGKSFMQVEWAWQVFQRTGNRVLILAPLCVAEQTCRESEKLGYPLRYVREFKRNGETGLYITNYEMLEHFEEADERHIAPLQLDLIQRCLRLWSIDNDIVLSPFMGIGSEGFVSLQMKRRFIGFELKKSYFDCAVQNLKDAPGVPLGDVYKPVDSINNKDAEDPLQGDLFAVAAATEEDD